MVDREQGSRRLRLLCVITALCYLIGYPLALGAHSAIGWVFVALGGPFLFALLMTVIQRVHSRSVAERARDEDSSS
jgi:cyanate permease